MEDIRIAIQKSGRLKDQSLQLLQDCGITVENGFDQLKTRATSFPLEVLYLRNSDIPRYVDQGVADLGIIGENLLYEHIWSLRTLVKLGFAKCRLSIAASPSTEIGAVHNLAGLRIATSYPNSLKRYLSENQVSAEVHDISGSVEIAPGIGLADAICDLVSTGNTLFRNQLEEKLVLFQSEAILVSGTDISAVRQLTIDKLVFRIQSVLASRQYKYLLMNAPDESLPRITQILPGMKSPTVMPLAMEGWSSVHTVIEEKRFWEIIDELRSAGAEGILVVPIEKMIAS